MMQVLQNWLKTCIRLLTRALSICDYSCTGGTTALYTYVNVSPITYTSIRIVSRILLLRSSLRIMQKDLASVGLNVREGIENMS
jgi:hypothetical protein